jgi:hypothetical protein
LSNKPFLILLCVYLSSSIQHINKSILIFTKITIIFFLFTTLISKCITKVHIVSNILPLSYPSKSNFDTCACACITSISCINKRAFSSIKIVIIFFHQSLNAAYVYRDIQRDYQWQYKQWLWLAVYSFLSYSLHYIRYHKLNYDYLYTLFLYHHRSI